MKTSINRTAFLGLGGGGSRIVGTLAAEETIAAADVAVADTHLQALEPFGHVQQIALGQEWARAEGCGGDVVLGERAASASASELRAFLSGARLLIAVAGLGGGTGTGAAKVVAHLARDADITAIFVVTLPFAFEGSWRRQEAERSLTPLRELVDVVIAVPNDLLFTELSANTPAERAFQLADEVLASGVGGLARILSSKGLVTADFATLRTLLRHRNATCTLGIGHGSGPTAWQDAVDDFLACPLVGGREAVAKADAAVVTLLGGSDLSIGEIQTCLTALQQHFPESARVVAGAYPDAKLGNELQVTGLICTYHDAAAVAPAVAPAPVLGKPEPPSGDLPLPSRAAPSAPVQGELPLQEQALGIFSGVQPTTVAGENLDIPTFQRRGIELDVGG